MLRRQHEAEKAELHRVIQNKNIEINGFRVELEAILTEMETLKQQQQQSTRKRKPAQAWN